MATSRAHPARLCAGDESGCHAAFTIIELLVSVAIIATLGIVLAALVHQTSSLWRWTSSKAEQFQESRDAFEALTLRISQATLNTYWDYNSTTLPTLYERKSELRFVSGPASRYLGNGPNGPRVTHCIFFHAPFGMVDASQSANAGIEGLEGLLNAWGYYVEFNSDSNFRPGFLSSPKLKAFPPRYRFRLMEFRQSSEQLATYRYTSGLDPTSSVAAAAIGYQGTDWFKPLVNVTAPPSRVLAENIVALIITPRLSKQDEQALPANLASTNPDYSALSPDYSYDSTVTANLGQPTASALTNPKNQLPPVLQITLVAIDEASANRLNLTALSSNIFGVSNKFSLTANYTTDLAINRGAPSSVSLENTLIAQKVNYRIFTTSVPIRAAKWSRDELN